MIAVCNHLLLSLLTVIRYFLWHSPHFSRCSLKSAVNTTNKSILISWRMKQGQRRSPWLLILRLHSCVVFVCACIRHYFPRRQGNHLNRGWLHRVMGVSPPAGSLSAALLAWSPFRWGLGLDGSIIVPDGVVAIQLAIGCFVDGRIRLAPYLAVVDRCGQPGCKNRTN